MNNCCTVIENALVVKRYYSSHKRLVKMRRMKAAPACAAFNYVSLLSCPWKSRKLRTASSPRRTSRLRPFGLSTLGIRDTGQNASKAQNAFRSLHYVAETTCRPPLVPPSPQFPHLILGDRPHVAWGQAPKSAHRGKISELVNKKFPCCSHEPNFHPLE